MTPLPPDLLSRLAGAPAGVDTVEALAALWLADNAAERQDDDVPWSVICVMELGAHPEEAWIFVREALAAAGTVWQAVMIAAGPLEDLIAEHGAAVIDRIEREARQSPRFCFALTGVWPQGNQRSPVWARVEAARAAAKARGIDAGGPLPPA